MANRSILLIISGSIAAYKSLDLIRRLRERNIAVNVILTQGGAQFVTPLSIASLTGTPVYSELFSLKDEVEMGHIRLSRESDLVVVAPASANILAKMAVGLCDDLATTALLATDKPVLIAPAMNTKMWEHAATQRNLAQLQQDGIALIPPGSGELACGEFGQGRMAEPDVILQHILLHLEQAPAPTKSLQGMKALVTSGPTHEPIDPVRFLANRSSGKQGHAIAAALASLGAEVTLVSGPTAQSDPKNVKTIHVTTAREMLVACEKALPVEVAVCAAAVSDWRMAQPAAQKMKKRANSTPPALQLAENPDILHTLATHKQRPRLVIGFAAETEEVVKNASAKRRTKKCDWILANDTSQGKGFDADDNQVTLITAQGSEAWPRTSKQQIAQRLATKIAESLSRKPTERRLANGRKSNVHC